MDILKGREMDETGIEGVGVTSGWREKDEETKERERKRERERERE